MPAPAIDRIALALASAQSRRSAAATLAATALAACHSAKPVASKKKKHRCKNKCDGKCIPVGDVCCNDGFGYCHAGQACCPAVHGFPEGFCMPSGSSCCRDSYCYATEQCCPRFPRIPTPRGASPPVRNSAAPSMLAEAVATSESSAVRRTPTSPTASAPPTMGPATGTARRSAAR